jgi:hypothetical protein
MNMKKLSKLKTLRILGYKYNTPITIPGVAGSIS